MRSGEKLAQAALQIELLICEVAGVECEAYIGRSQYPTIVTAPAMGHIHKDGDKFSAPAANFWGILAKLVNEYARVRTNAPKDPRHAASIRAITKHAKQISTYGQASNSKEMEEAVQAKELGKFFQPEWKPESKEVIDTRDGKVTISAILKNLDNHANIDLDQVSARCLEIRDSALAERNKESSASWKSFVIEQLTKGAGTLHKWANNPNSLPSVPLFDVNATCKTPIEQLKTKSDAWAKYWQKPKSEWNAEKILYRLANMCRNNVSLNSKQDQYDAPRFTVDKLAGSAKNYRKISKGSDHWLAAELRLPLDILQPIADAIDNACCQLAWPHQMLLNLNP